MLHQRLELAQEGERLGAVRFADLRGHARQGGSQALDLQPAQGGYVEFTFEEAGLYLMVTHKFSNVGKGALGVFQAGEVPEGITAEH